MNWINNRNGRDNGQQEQEEPMQQDPLQQQQQPVQQYSLKQREQEQLMAMGLEQESEDDLEKDAEIIRIMEQNEDNDIMESLKNDFMTEGIVNEVVQDGSGEDLQETRVLDDTEDNLEEGNLLFKLHSLHFK